MEGVEGLLKQLQLSEAEKKTVRIGSGSGTKGKAEAAPLKAFGKVLSERSVRPETIEQAIGWIWCPMKGIECKDLGDNFFLLIFGQAAGKRKALEEGPWMISKELLVVADYDGSKTLDEIDFSFIPIWVRVANLPMGLMNGDTVRAIGEEVGEFMKMESKADDMAARRFLRLKVRLDIRKPLMRGVTISPGEGVDDRWSPLSYEYLPDFCYCCGVIGHTDKSCQIKLGKNEKPPFSRELRFVPPKRRFGGEGGRLGEGRPVPRLGVGDLGRGMETMAREVGAAVAVPEAMLHRGGSRQEGFRGGKKKKRRRMK